MSQAITFRSLIVSLLPIIFMAMIVTGFLMWLKYKFDKIEKRIKQLSQQIGGDGE